MDKEEKEKRTIKTHEDLVIYQKAFDAAMTIFELSKQFPTEERYSLTGRLRCAASLSKFVVVLAPFVQTSPKHGEKEDIKHHL